MITYGSTTLTSYNSIVRTEVYYYKSTSATSLSGGSWSTTKPTWENGKYIWQKIRTVYEDGTHTESDPVNITGQQGATGTAAYSYKLNSSDSIIGKTKDGEYTIKKITFSATYKQGTGAVSAYSGRFKIESTINGSTWKTEYTSSGNEASKEFTIPDDIIAIKCSLYQSDGMTVLLDIVTVPVVKDGVDAIGLRNSIPYYLASDKDTGVTRLTQGWTRYRPQLTAEKKYLWVYYVSRYSEGTTEPELIEIKDDLVHFENNGDESPVESCVVDIEPVQDLNGYDHPWPKGGGKNKFDITAYTPVKQENGVIFTINDDGSVTLNGIATAQSQIYWRISTDVAINYSGMFLDCFETVSNGVVAILEESGGSYTQYALNNTAEGSAISTDISSLTNRANLIIRVVEGTQLNNFKVYPMIRSSSVDGYEPYSNICPITGWTGVQIWDDPKYSRLINWNQKLENPHFDEGTNGLQYWASTNVSVSNLEDGSISLTITAVHETQSYYNLFRQDLATITTKQHKFLVLWDYKPAHTHNVVIFLMRSSGASGNYGQTINNVPAGKWNRLAYFVPAQDRAFHQLQFALNATVNSGYSVGDVDYIRYPQMFDLTEMFGAGNEPTTLDEFKALFPKDCYDYNSEVTCVSAVSGEPYAHVQVSWQSEVGTVYSGQLNVITGELVVNKAFKVFNGSEKWEFSPTSFRPNIKITDIAYKGAVICNMYPYSPVSAAIEGTISTNGGGGYNIWIKDSINGDSLANWKTFLATNNLQVIYELATPITYQLTPQEITMLCKENNIFANTSQTAISYYDNQTSTDPYVDYSLTSAFDASTNALDKAKEVAQDLADLGADLQAQIDGKIETWCQKTDPSTAWTTTELKNQHNGDLWYYTGESTSSYKNNTTYKYTASTNKWTAYSASTDLFDKIDAKTSIYYGKPSAVTQNLEVGDYLVDNTDGCSYRWDGSKWVKLTDYKAAIDEIEVGGRNLLKWTANPKANGTYYKKNPEETDGWYAWNSSIGAIIETDNGIKFTHNSSTTSAGIVIPLASLNAVIGEIEYVLSFKYRTNLTSIGSPYLLCQADENINYGQAISIIQSETEWKYFNYKIQWSSSSGRNTWAILIPYINTSNGWIEIQNGSMKLEKGNKPTAWTPAPEDIDASIATAQSTADTAMDRATAIYGTCSTDSTVDAKVVICPDFVLFDGARIQVTFTNANTASAPTLNINNTGAKAIYINKTVASDTNQLLWTAGSKMEFVYDGTGWVAQNVPYALYGTCSTGASTAAKDVTCNEAVICKGTTISVNMTNTNTAANATMNVGSTLAKDIYANGAKLTTNSRFNWRANTTQKFVFDGQVWRMDDDSVKALATAYITEIDDDGIMVHPEDDDTSGWAISDAIQLFKNGISYIKLWIENNIPKIRIGKEDQGHIILDNDSVDIRNDDKVLASFGATSVIGDENDWHQTIAANQITFAKGDDIITYISPDKLYTINAEVADAFYISNYSIRNASDGKLVIGLRR